MEYKKNHNESVKEIRSIIDCVKNVRALKVLDYKQNKLADILLVNIFQQKYISKAKQKFNYYYCY